MFPFLCRVIPSRIRPSPPLLSHIGTHFFPGSRVPSNFSMRVRFNTFASMVPCAISNSFHKICTNYPMITRGSGSDGSLNYIWDQKRNFAGRQRGLKRRKHKKEPRRIQVSLGRRLELFYPKNARKVRIRLIQNSRGNVIYDPVLKKFYVFYYKQGTQVFRGFRATGGKFEIARSKAINFARQMGDFYNKRLEDIRSKYENSHNIERNEGYINYGLKLQPDCSLSGVRNVFFDSKRTSWVVCYNEFGIRKYKFFDVNDLGFQNAYVNAVDFLKFQLYKNHRFLHRRHRTRKNRPLFKC